MPRILPFQIIHELLYIFATGNFLPPGIKSEFDKFVMYIGIHILGFISSHLFYLYDNIKINQWRVETMSKKEGKNWNKARKILCNDFMKKLDGKSAQKGNLGG